MRKTSIALVALGLFFASAAAAGAGEMEENGLPLSCGAEAGIYSKYIWRGLEVNDKGVSQPEVWVSLYGFEAGVWGNLELTDTLENKGKFIEVDYSLLGSELRREIADGKDGFWGGGTLGLVF